MLSNTSLPFINEAILAKLAEANIPVIQKRFSADEQILVKGDYASGIYIIQEGEARVYLIEDRKIELSVLQGQQFFGEMSCLTGDPVSAYVEAVTQLEVIILNRDGLLLLMDEIPAFRMQMIESMVTRIKNSNERVIQEHTKNVLLVQQQDSELNKYGELIGESDELQALKKLIDQHASAKLIQIVGEKGTEKVTVARKLHEQSEKLLYPFVVLPKEQLDLAQIHSKLLVVNDGTLVIDEADEIEPEIVQTLLANVKNETVILLCEKPLVFVQQAATISIAPIRERVEDIRLIAYDTLLKVGATNPVYAISDEAIRMLELYPFLENNVDELKAVVTSAYTLSEGRTIYGRHIKFGRNRKPGERPKIGLALGSGSTKGIAHLGVWEALEKANIPIDMVAGTSIGSVIGGMMAYGFSYEESSDIFRTLSWGKLVRPTLPIRSFVHNTPMYNVIRSYVGDVNIEDLKLPFAALASELATGDAYIMRSGKLVDACCASTAIPTIIRPMDINGKLLVDGAVVHPVPAALTRSMGADIVIAVNICKEPSTQGNIRHIMESLMNTIDIMSSKLVREELQMADIVIRPDFEEKAIKFKDFDFAYAAGNHAATGMIEQIKMQLQSV